MDRVFLTAAPLDRLLVLKCDCSTHMVRHQCFGGQVVVVYQVFAGWWNRNIEVASWHNPPPCLPDLWRNHAMASDVLCLCMPFLLRLLPACPYSIYCISWYWYLQVTVSMPQSCGRLSRLRWRCLKQSCAAQPPRPKRMAAWNCFVSYQQERSVLGGGV